MRISHKHKFVFIATPKTGSTTIRKSLAKYSDIKSVGDKTSPYYWHTSALELKEHFNEKNWNWNEYFKFTFVRNPWSRCVSKWEHRKRVSNNQTLLDNRDEFAIQSRNLIHKWKSFRGMLRRGHVGNSQYNWCFDASGNQLVDFIGKTENFQEDFNTICDKIKIPQQQLPRKNATKHKHYTEYYDDETKQIVAEKYAKDIAYFGYEFGE